MELLTISQVAERLKCHVRTVQRIVDRGEIPTILVGKRQRISEDALAAYLTQSKGD